MRAELYRNIDLVRVPIRAGVNEYYLPQNVDWAKCKVDRIAACIPATACVDPYDGSTPVMTISDVQNMYFDFYADDQREILHACNWQNIWHRNNNPLYLNSKLDLRLCRVYFTTAPAQDMTLLLYVYHDNKIVEDHDVPDKSVSVEFELAAGQEINLQEVIATYVHALPATIKGIAFWAAESAPAYITLRNYKQTYILQHLHSELARPLMNGGSAVATQIAPMYFDNIDINFQYSHIRNCGSTSAVQKITIWY